MVSTARRSAQRVVWWILAAALISLWGARLTFVGTGIWLFQGTNSTTQLAMVAACALLPGLSLQPWAGRLIDRFSARLIWCLGVCASLACSGGLWVLLHFESLSLGQLMLLAGAASAASAVNQPFVMKAFKLHLSASEYLKFNGMRTIGFSVVELSVPVVAAFILARWQLITVVALDCATLSICLLMIGFGWYWLPCKQIAPADRPREPKGGSISSVRSWVWRIVALQWLAGVLMITLMPVAMERLSTVGYGATLTLAGVGGVFGTLVCTRWVSTQGYDRLSDLGLVIVSGGLLLLGVALEPFWFMSLAVVVGGLYAATLCLMHTGCLAAIDEAVAGELMGRVFLWGGVATLISVGLTGVLVDGLAEFLSISSGRASAWMLMGNALVVAVLSVWLSGRWRSVLCGQVSP